MDIQIGHITIHTYADGVNTAKFSIGSKYTNSIPLSYHEAVVLVAALNAHLKSNEKLFKAEKYQKT